MLLNLNCKYLEKFISFKEYFKIKTKIEQAHNLLHFKNSRLKEYLGWVSLPKNYNKTEFNEILNTAKKIQSDSEVLVVIGIGGSYIGTRAAIEFLKSNFYNNLPKNTPNIYFVGNSISASSLCDVLKLCNNKKISLNVISKSGTTTEPMIAFKIFKEFMEKSYGRKETASRIYCTTGAENSVLKTIATENGYKIFNIPKDIGGRFSVLTAAGLLPISVSGANISKIMKGALFAYNDSLSIKSSENQCYKYAAIRNILYKKSKNIEITAFFEPRFSFLGKWIEQLFGESEGKDLKGIFPTSMIFSTELHSMGQFIQDGSRNIFETILFIDNVGNDIKIENSKNMSSFDFLSGKTMNWVNKKAFEGTVAAHEDGNVPVVILQCENASEETLGYIFYFFEKACAISSLIMGVNPFNQPGVENYKKNMFTLLGKPGYENYKKI
ncbi:MAG: glucose-6-phosphate isomerase [Oscillospiraceae bacterium]|jgi:glucose-6-phosphate isomerase|nr:glucose-6-phosphate isomerase [Oscillospiraceae bacterium]